MKSSIVFLICSLALLFCIDMQAMEGGTPPSYEQAISQLPQVVQITPPPPYNASREPVKIVKNGASVRTVILSPIAELEYQQEDSERENRHLQQIQDLARLHAPDDMLVAREQVMIHAARHATLCKRLQTTYKDGVWSRCVVDSIVCCIPPIAGCPCCVGYVCCNNECCFNSLVEQFGNVGTSYYDGKQVVAPDYPFGY